jgi:hypothetical protein
MVGKGRGSESSPVAKKTLRAPKKKSPPATSAKAKSRSTARTKAVPVAPVRKPARKTAAAKARKKTAVAVSPAAVPEPATETPETPETQS